MQWAGTRQKAQSLLLLSKETSSWLFTFCHLHENVPLPWGAQVSSGFPVSIWNETSKLVLRFLGQSTMLGTWKQGRKLVGFCLQSLFVAPAAAGHLRCAWSGWALIGSSVSGCKWLGSSVPCVSIFLLGPVDLPILVLPRLMAEPQEGR